MAMGLMAALTGAIVLLTVAQQTAGDTTARPWFGTWALRAEDAKGDPETLVYTDAGNGAMRMESLETQSVIVTRFDGEPVPDTGARAVSGKALAVTAISPTRYEWTFWRQGSPFVAGVNTLADDLQSFTEVSWLVSKPDQKVTLVYERR